MMQNIPHYQIIKQVYESTYSIVYQAIRNIDNQAVILKVLKAEYPTLEELKWYRQEYEITHFLAELEGIIAVYSIEKYQNTLIMCLEDFGGQSLKIWQDESVFTLEQVLILAIRAAEILSEIHQRNVIHKDINPSNIIWNPSTETLKFIDFGISSQLSKEYLTFKSPNILEGTLAYISPEQTGRMNCALDYRTDFYSLGVTLYELFTGVVPFKTTDAMELIHCHIAKQPLPLDKFNPSIPAAVSNIIMKLLEKNPENRYQSALGIKIDLENCFKQWQTHRSIDIFPLASFDISGRFQIPQKLYGRDNETQTLLQAFERVSLGSNEIVLVAGYSGVGKSALVHEVHKPITEKQGYFAAGKFDQYQRDIPYFAFSQAFNEFCHYLLTESNTQLDYWRATILNAVGNNGQVLIELIHDLELVIGKQPAIIKVGPFEMQNRFNRVFQSFIHAISQREHPLVLFIDDWQWADSASLNLLSTLMTNTENQYFLIIGAYRDNEVNPSHPFMLTVEDLKQAEVIVNTIQLPNLSLTDVNTLIADALANHDLTQTQDLANLVYDKTQGNAFFTHKFLQSLYEEQLLVFNWQTQKWHWETDKITAQNLASNVIELMVNRISQLAIQTSQLLELAACIGNQFDLQTLSVIYQQTPQEVLTHLWPAIKEGLLLPLDDNYKLLDNQATIAAITQFKFQHDRIQQAAYSLINDYDRKITHLQIGRLLLNNIEPTVLEDKVFDIVNQLNEGCELIKDNTEKFRLAELNLLAGQKAETSMAYQQALKYFKIGIGLLEDNSWQTHYHLTLSLYESATRAAYLNSDFSQQEQLAKIVLTQAQSLLNKMGVYEANILAYIAQNKQQQALQAALPILKELGVELLRNCDQEYIRQTLKETQLTWEGRTIESFALLPITTDENQQAALRILAVLTSCTFEVAPEVFIQVGCKLVQLSVKYGNAPVSAMGYACFGMIAVRAMDDIEVAYQFGQLAISVLERLNAKAFKAKVLNIVESFITHWKAHYRDILKTLQEGYQSGLEVGDFEYAAYSAFHYSTHAFYSGRELAVLEREMVGYSNVLRQLKQNQAVNYNEIYRQSAINLMKPVANPCQLVGEAYNEEHLLPLHHQQNEVFALFLLYTQKILLACMFQEHHQTLENITLIEPYAVFYETENMVIINFCDSLTRLAICPNVPAEKQQYYLDKVRSNQEKMRDWANHAPMNFLHKFYLVEAEYARVLDKEGEARVYYDKAIALAQEHEYLNEEALAHELAGQFYLAKGQIKLAQVYLRDAHYAYQKWGAMAKVRDLENKYPQFLIYKTSRLETQMSSTISMTGISSTPNTSNWLDLNSVIKASQTLSREMRLKHLLKTMIQIIVENAGAVQGCLLSEQAGNWVIEVSENYEEKREIQLATTTVNYVARTQEAIVLNNAAKEGQFTQDPYIISHQPKSILCVPLINQNKLVGIIYLENNLATGAFTPERVETVQLLGAQAAISLENARLYENLAEYNHTLETKVEERTQELSQTLEHLQATQQELIQSEKMAALGQLIAGIAHEINTPLGAIRASINNITDALNDSIHQLPQLLRELSTEQQELFFTFTQQAFQPKSPLTSREERQLKRKLIKELEEQDLEDIDDIADTLVDMGLYQDIEPFIPLLTAANSELILQVAYDLATQQTNSQNIETAIERASKIIFALKSYARYDHAGQAVKANLVEGLNVVLTLYHNQLKHGIELTTNYQEIPEILCYPDELNQVWTNLIHNAIQAMNNHGQLDIEVFSQAEQVVVQITDSGVGILAEIKDRIFEPFFTTKGAGEGSGLGLDIVKKIIDKHQGNIMVESQPGKTTFSIFLPMITT